MDAFPEQFTSLQRDFLSAFFAREQRFCLIGGGALAYYLPQRAARALDLVGPKQVPLADQLAIFKNVARSIGAQIAFPERSAALLRCSIRRSDDTLQVDQWARTEFMHGGEMRRFGAIWVESPLTLAAHKLLAVCQRSRARDLQDLCELLASGLSLSDVIAQTLHRQPTLDLGSLHAAIVSWPGRLPQEEAPQCEALQPVLQDLLCRVRSPGFETALDQTPSGSLLLRAFSPLQYDIVQALFRRERRFSLTGRAALALHDPAVRADDLTLRASHDVEAAGIGELLQHAAMACSARAQLVRTEPGLVTACITRDEESCLVHIGLEKNQGPVLPQERFGEVIVDSTRALAAHSLVQLRGSRKFADFLLFSAAIELGASIEQAVLDARAIDPDIDLLALTWALATLDAGEVGPLESTSKVSRSLRVFMRVLRALAYEEASGQPLASVQTILTRHGARPICSRQPILYLMGGGFASGKSTLKAWLIQRGQLPATNVVQVDPDLILASLSAYWDRLARGEIEEANAIHEESDAIAREVLRQAMELRLDILQDVALGKPDRVLSRIQRARQAGYQIHLTAVTIDPAVAIARAAARAAATGRTIIRIETLLASHQGFLAGFPAYLRAVDKVMLYDTSMPEPILVASREPQTEGEAGPLVIHSPELYERFLSRADSNADTHS